MQKASPVAVQTVTRYGIACRPRLLLGVNRVGLTMSPSLSVYLGKPTACLKRATFGHGGCEE
jgi:hypothetical protein